MITLLRRMSLCYTMSLSFSFDCRTMFSDSKNNTGYHLTLLILCSFRASSNPIYPILSCVQIHSMFLFRGEPDIHHMCEGHQQEHSTSIILKHPQSRILPLTHFLPHLPMVCRNQVCLVAPPPPQHSPKQEKEVRKSATY